jgi:hypothetical protein
VPERKSGLESLRASDLSSAEIADALWLASFVTERVLPTSGDTPAASPGDEPPPPSTGPESPGPSPVTSATPLAMPDERTGARSAASSGVETMGDAHSPLRRPPLPLAMTRALRPLRRPVLLDENVVLNEDRTAEQAAEAGVWLPVFDRVPERWADAVLVVDDSPMMELWHPTVTEFGQLLQRLGSFRTVQTRRIRMLDGRCTMHSASGEVSPQTLIDSTARRSVLVFTDGIGEMWRTGEAQAMVHLWARSQPVSVVHLLPQHMWRHSQVRPRRARLRARTPFAPNRAVSYELLDTWLDGDDDEQHDGLLPVPVLELGPRSLGQWARLLLSRGEWTDLPVLLTGPGQQPEPGDTADELGPRDKVARFRAMTTPTAFALATALAATPLTLPSMLAVQRVLVPASHRSDLAELVVSGLIKPVESDVVTMDFVDGVRAELLSHARRADTMVAVRAAVDLFGGRVPSVRRLGAVLDDPDTGELPDLAVESAREVALETAVMRALSGPYLSRARRLDGMRGAGSDTAALRIDGLSDRAEQTVSDTAPLPAMPETVALPETVGAEDDLVTAESTELVLSRPVRGGRLVGGEIPPRNPDFVGRSDILDDIDRLLLLGGIVTLTGMDGVGKSQTAAEYVHRHLRDYDLVWWIRAGQVGSTWTGLQDLAREMGLPSGPAADVIPAVHTALQAGRLYERWLLVFDDAADPGLRAFIPSAGRGACLLTSHDPRWNAVSRTVEVGVFDREQSVELLVNRVGVPAAQADLIAGALGDLPVALDQAARWLSLTGMPVPEYLSLLLERTGELLFETDDALKTTWSLSMDLIADRDPAAKRLLDLCALAPEPLVISRLYAIRDQFPFLPRELATALRDPIRLGHAIHALTRHSLVRLDHAGDRIELHPVFRALLVHRMRELDRRWLATGARMLMDHIGQPS